MPVAIQKCMVIGILEGKMEKGYTIDIAALRVQLVELMKEGFTEIPLQSLWVIIREAALVEQDDG